jgi:O-acetyl-ADP-ribose deacetylase (regulator of RNase III)
MSVTEHYEDIFQSPVQSIIVPVNTVGVMGAGLALEFKQRVPGLFDAYRQLCRSGRFGPDSLWRYRWQETGQQVICFPTKCDWRHDSDRDMVIRNLKKLADSRERLEILSLAIPPVGCGLGRLEYHGDIREHMIGILGTMGCEVRITLPN